MQTWSADQCAGSGQVIDRHATPMVFRPLGGCWVPCPQCGRRVTVPSTGKVFPHKPGHYDPKDWEHDERREHEDRLETLVEALALVLTDPAFDATTRRMAQQLFDRLDVIGHLRPEELDTGE